MLVYIHLPLYIHIILIILKGEAWLRYVGNKYIVRKNKTIDDRNIILASVILS
jgi:hypothetical protein